MSMDRFSSIDAKNEAESYEFRHDDVQMIINKLNESMDNRELKLSQLIKVLKSSGFRGRSNKKELFELQIRALEHLNHQTAPEASNDYQNINELVRKLNERRSKLDSDKSTIDARLNETSIKRSMLEKELKAMTRKLDEARTEEKQLNTDLHKVTIELSSTNDQISIAESMKQRITSNLCQMSGAEKRAIDEIHGLKQQMGSEWKQFEARWKKLYSLSFEQWHMAQSMYFPSTEDA